jgi:ABC-type Na+ transport system ATPase subunit NatA
VLTLTSTSAPYDKLTAQLEVAFGGDIAGMSDEQLEARVRAMSADQADDELLKRARSMMGTEVRKKSTKKPKVDDDDIDSN